MGDLKDIWKAFKKKVEEAYPGLELTAEFTAFFPGRAEVRCEDVDALIQFLDNFPKDKKEERTDGKI